MHFNACIIIYFVENAIERFPYLMHEFIYNLNVYDVVLFIYVLPFQSLFRCPKMSLNPLIAKGLT